MDALQMNSFNMIQQQQAIQSNSNRNFAFGSHIMPKA